MRCALIDYLDSIKSRDPAARSRLDVLFYPGLWALALHRAAHWLWQRRFYFVARLINHLARFLTTIDIHPGAKIGRNFFVDHGFSVIGETAEIGNDVTIYQNVTLGGTNPSYGAGSKRHPSLGAGVVIGSGAQIIGPIELGEGVKVGANSVVTRDVAPGETVVGIPARPVEIETTQAAPTFVPYGTPFGADCDPERTRLAALEDQIETLRNEIAQHKAALRRPKRTSG